MLSCSAYFSLNVMRHNTVSGFLGLVSSYFLQQCYLFQCILEIKKMTKQTTNIGKNLGKILSYVEPL